MKSQIQPFREEIPDKLRYVLESKEASVPTFSETLNENLNGGLRRKMLISIAALSGEGKTTFAWQLAQHIAEQGKRVSDYTIPVPCLYISLEMSGESLYYRALSRISHVEHGVIVGHRWLDQEDPEEKEKLLKELVRANTRFTKIARNLGVMDITRAVPYQTTVEDIGQHAREFLATYRAHLELDLMRDTPLMKERERLTFVLQQEPHLVLFIDNMPLLREEYSNGGIGRDTILSYRLKHLAVALNCTIVAVSQATYRSGINQATEPDPGDIQTAVEGADLSAVIRVGYSLIDEKIEELAREQREMKAVASEETREVKRVQTEYARAKSQHLLKGSGNPIYATLEITKNRDGGIRPCLFIWRRNFHEFEEVREAGE